MFEFYLAVVVLLFVLAVLDLSVGVSNDAVNFLNSAIGSQVASRRTILIVASVGILFGAMFSSGMMEVARKGIFNPELFTFADVVVILLAVMLADVILLDLFNTYGLPTSTTVSIVFELLGASVVVATLIVMASPDATSIAPYINGSSALAIVSGILLSVGVAFTVGTAVQFFSRLLFTFDRKRHGPLLIAVWSAIALTAISDFLFVKGLKGVSFVSRETVAGLHENLALTLSVLFAAWWVIVLALQRAGFQPLKLVVLAGTFALAMAFASNDLVNFIGVPLAGLASWQSWESSGVPADAFLMEALAEPVRGDTFWLAGAGLVMVVTLWFSAKARTVTDTEVNLGRQDSGVERFRPGPVSRGIVGASIVVGRAIPRWFPVGIRRWIEARFERSRGRRDGGGPAFDLIRASVNLTVAAILIAIATSMKLPLSTTYVSFMVAMGTSLADRAWGPDSSVYRVSGVLSVIAGWFATAFVAFTAAGLFALIIHRFQAGGVLFLAVLAAAALFHNYRNHKRRATPPTVPLSLAGLPGDLAEARMAERLRTQLQRLEGSLLPALTALETGESSQLDKAQAGLSELADATHALERSLVAELRRARLLGASSGIRLLALFDIERGMLQSARTINRTCDDFVRNGHMDIAPEVATAIRELRSAFARGLAMVAAGDADAPAAIASARGRVEAARSIQLAELARSERSDRNGAMQLTVLQQLLEVTDALASLGNEFAQPRSA